ncbi:MAG: thioredoxin family protein, partial [Thermodesulfobacteriota bacterium]
LGLLTWVASTGDPLFGFIIFFTLSLGLGLPLFVLALFAGRLHPLPPSGEWLNWVRKVMGWVLVAMAAYFLRPLVPPAAAVGITAVIGLAAGLHLGWLDRSTAAFAAFAWIRKGVGVAAIALAVAPAIFWLLRGPGVAWQPYSPAILEEAKREGRPVVLDFSAAWCAPCRKLDEVTFHDPAVVAQSRRFVMVKVDLTTADDPLHRQLVQDYGVMGVPTVVFLDRTGKERRDLRLVDYMAPAQLVPWMEKIP